MKINKIYKKGVSSVNEDDYLIKDNLFVVFDGAGSLTEFRLKDGRTGGRLAADIAKNIFSSKIGQMEEAAREVNKKIVQEENKYKIDLTKKETLWSVAIAGLKIRDDKLDFFGVGDCFILSISNKGTFNFIIPYQDHDEETLLLMQRFNKQGVTNVREEIMPQLMKVRRISNRTYGFLNGEKAAERFFIYGEASLDNIKSIIISTDGLILPSQDPAKEPDWHKFVQLYQKNGLAEIYKYVYSLEESDPNCIKYPRFKKHDDKAAISIDFE